MQTTPGHDDRRGATAAPRPRLASLVLALTLLAPLGGQGCALLIAGGAAGGAAGAATAARDSRDEEHGAGTYVGTVLANVVYVPTKVLFAGVGALASGVTYVATLGSRGAAGRVWRTTVDGTYVLTPNMLEGREPVRFVGS